VDFRLGEYASFQAITTSFRSQMVKCQCRQIPTNECSCSGGHISCLFSNNILMVWYLYIIIWISWQIVMMFYRNCRLCTLERRWSVTRAEVFDCRWACPRRRPYRWSLVIVAR